MPSESPGSRYIPGSKISMTGEVDSISPPNDRNKMGARKLKKAVDVPPPPSSFDALVSPHRRYRNSIAITQQVPSSAPQTFRKSIAVPRQSPSKPSPSAFRKKSGRARSPGPRPTATVWESEQAFRAKTVPKRSNSTDSGDSWAYDDDEEDTNFQKRMHRSISPPPLASNSPISPGRAKRNVKRAASPPPPPPPLSPGQGSSGPITSRGRQPKSSPFRNASHSRSVSRSISPSISPQGKKRESISNNYFSSMSSPNGAGAKFRKRESLSPAPPSAFRNTASPGQLRGRKSIAIIGGSVSGSDGPGAKFRRRESMSPVPASNFRSYASPGSLRGRSPGSLRGTRRSIAVTGLSLSAHGDAPSGKSRRRTSLREELELDGLASVSSHDGPGAQFRRRESMEPGEVTPGSYRGERIVAELENVEGLTSVSSHDGPGGKVRRRESMDPAEIAPGSFRGERTVAELENVGGLTSVSSHDGPGARIRKRESLSPGSLRGRRMISSSLKTSRSSSFSPSISPDRKPKSKALSKSEHGREDHKAQRRESLTDSFKELPFIAKTPPSGGRGRKSLALPSQQKSLSSHGPSRMRQSIAISSGLSEDNSRSLDALVTPVQRGKKTLGMINEKQHDVPSFATPRQTMMKGSKKWTSTYLDKPMGGPRGVVKKKNRGLSPVSMGQHSGSYINKSPGGFNGRMSISGGSLSPVTPNQHSGSFLNKSPGGFNSRVSMSPGSLSRMSISKIAMVGPPNLDETPEDISIQVTIPDIELRIKARKEQKLREAQSYSIPEHIRKYREREERVKTAQEEKEYRQKELAVAMIYGWAARVKYKNMKKERDMRLAKIAKEKAVKELRDRSALKLQTRYRMYVNRKRYLHVIDCKRRRERNAKQIKKIEKRLAKIPKETSNELKAMKKEHIRKKKEMKREMKKLKVTDDAEQQHQNLIEYLREENRKLKEQRHSIQTDHSLLQKQFELLEKKSAEIDKRFKSLKKFVVHKNESIQKTEAVLHKCRNKYVPNHRKELANRNLHCATERRIKEMYKKRLDRILDEINTVAKERELRKDAKRAAREVKRELAKIPVLETPQELQELMDELDWTRRMGLHM